MSLKALTMWRTLVLSYLVAVETGKAGLISLENEDHHHQNDLADLHDHHVSVASSFMHFHGPVEGPEFEVKVPYVVHHQTSDQHSIRHDEADGETHAIEQQAHEAYHHGYTVDYMAHPKYQFSYGVEDHHTGDFHGQKETRDGSSVSGEYSVQEPGGGMRIVTYHADKDGFHAVVHRTGKNDHSGATYSADAHQHRQGHHHAHQEIHIQEQPHHHGHRELQVQGEDHHQQEVGHGLSEYAEGYASPEDY